MAKKLIEKGYNVKGTTTSSSKLELLQNEDITPFEINISETGITGDIVGFLSHIETLIINVPPKLRGNPCRKFPRQDEIPEYRNREKWCLPCFVCEQHGCLWKCRRRSDRVITYHARHRIRQTIGRERKLFQEQEGFKTTIIRFGGLISPDRHPVTILSGKQNLTNGNHPINLIHLNDCIHMILTILEQAYWGELFNGVYPHHPKKQVYYFEEAQKRGLRTPSYKTDSFEKNGKIVSSNNFLEKGHSFTTSIIS